MTFFLNDLVFAEFEKLASFNMISRFREKISKHAKAILATKNINDKGKLERLKTKIAEASVEDVKKCKQF